MARPARCAWALGGAAAGSDSSTDTLCRLRGSARRCSRTSTTRPTSTRGQTQAALTDTDIRVPPLEAYADKLWDYWERHLDPDLFGDRTLLGAVRGRPGLVSGVAQVHRAADPRRVPAPRPAGAGLRLAGAGGARPGRDGHRGLLGHRALGGAEDRRRRRDRAARRPHAGEARGDQGADRGGGGIAHIHRCDLSDMDDLDGWPRRSSPSTATSTSWSTTPAARSAARSRSPTTASTTSSARCSSTTSGR